MTFRFLPSSIAVAASAAAVFVFTADAEIVSRDIGDPELNAWRAGEWVTCGGEITALDERPDDPAAPKGAKALRLKVNYLPKQFGGWNAAPLDKTIPGRPQKLTAWMRLGNDQSIGFDWTFEDAAGKKFKVYFHRPDGQKLELNRSWQAAVADFPQDAALPVKFAEAAQNNWGADQNPNPWSRILDVYDLRLHTDMAGVELKDRPCGLSVDYPVEGGIYFLGVDKPVFTVSAYSWTGGENEIRFEAKTIAPDGTERPFAIPPLKVNGSALATLELPVKEPSANRVVIRAQGFPQPVEISNRYVMCLPHRDFRNDEQKNSIYGINVHGGTFVGYERFGRLGFAWIRDYAYTFDWLRRARGNGDYGGWPWYPKLVSGAEKAGLMTLACLMGSPEFPDSVKPGDGRLTPSNVWRRDLAHALVSFPTLPAFELDNELDLRMKVPFADYAKGYAEFHRVFAEVTAACRPDALVVSEGSASIPVARIEQFVKDGTYRQVSVVNGHHYCGVKPPELATDNQNTGMAKAGRTALLDVLRKFKAAASADGKMRQAWLTEWGFDTLAVHIVSELEQAAYLQREWLMGMQAGLDKMFWYWNYDTSGKPKVFFDGCGLYDGHRDPKPSAAAFATLRAYIPGAYRYLGYATPAPNALVQIVEAEGKVLAAAFKVDPEGADVTLADPKAEKITDMFGRVLSRGERQLSVGPTWYIGLDRNCDWLKACPLDIASDRYVRTRSGDTFTVSTRTGDGCAYTLETPKGWTVAEKGGELVVSVPEATEDDAYAVTLVGRTKGVEKRIALDVDVFPAGWDENAPPPEMPKSCEFAKVDDGAIRLDGDLSDWPTANRIPASLFCLKEKKAKAHFYAGWSEKGLYLAVDAHDSKCIATDPEWFWDGADCFEVGVDTAFDRRAERKHNDTDAHYWMCPIVDENRLYVGRWGHDGRAIVKDDVLKSVVKTALRKNAKGYTAEIFIPASELKGWKGAAGAKIGFASTFVYQGKFMSDDISWPMVRKFAPFNQPGNWGEVTLK